MLVHRTDGTTIACNERCADLLQRSVTELTGIQMDELVATIDGQPLLPEWQQVCDGKRLVREVSLRKHTSGMQIEAELQSQAIGSEASPLIVTTLQPLGRSQHAEQRLEDNLRFVHDFFDTIPCPAFYKNQEGIYLGCNNAFAQQILGISAAELIGHSLFDLPEYIPPELAQIYYDHDQKLFAQGGHQIYETKVQCADGVKRDFLFSKSTFADRHGAVAGLCGVMIDLTQKAEAEAALITANRELQRLSQIDPLTEIANRRNFDLALDEHWQRQQQQAQPLTLMMIDIDFFKNYNDHYGHQAGDRCIRQVARALASQLVRQDDLVARYGGEEFALLLPGADREKALAIAERIRTAVEGLRIEHRRSGNGASLTVSIGFASLIPRRGQQATALLGLADKALYESKRQGRNCVTEGSDLFPI